MHGQALRNGWLNDADASRVVELLLLHAENEKPSVAISALDELIKIRALDIKEKELSLKERIADDKRRIAILSRLATVDPNELARRAKAIGVDIDGRAGIASGVDGDQAGKAARLEAAITSQPKAST